MRQGSTPLTVLGVTVSVGTTSTTSYKKAKYRVMSAIERTMCTLITMIGASNDLGVRMTYHKKSHYVRCECGWRLRMTPNTLFYKRGDYCKQCGNQLTEYNFLYKQANHYPTQDSKSLS
jgi:hypothetical protein